MINPKQLIKGKEQGFTLIETMIAIVLLAIVGLAVISGLGTAFKANEITEKYTTAMTWAQRQMEDLERQDYQPSGVYSAITPDPSYTIMSYNQYNTATVPGIVGYPWDTDTGAYNTAETDIQRIRLAVYRGTTEVLTLETYKHKAK